MINPCIDLCYTRYGKQYSPDCDDKCEYAKIAKEKKLLEKEMDRPIKTLGELASQFCCVTECKNCPIDCSLRRQTYCHEYEKRTKLDKEVLHEPCCTNLYKWIIEQSQKIYRS